MQLVRAADGTDIAVHDMGGTGPVLLFAHATGFHGRVWTPIAERLADQFHCVAIDFRGHGDTRAPEGHDFDWSWFADDVLGVVDTLVVDEPIFGVGHSKGGAALLMAEQRRPGTFASLYCYEPITFPRRESGTSAADVAANPLAAGALRRREVFASRAEARTNYASKPPFDGLDPAALSAYVDHGFDDLPDGTVRLKCRGANESATYTMSMRHDAYDRLGEIACPVTVARGAEEAPADNADAVAAALPLGRLERHDDLGHFGPLEAPDRIAGCIRAAFEETSDRTPLPPLDDEVDEPVAPSVASTTPTVGHAIGRLDAEIDRAWETLRGVPALDRLFYSASTLGDWSLVWHLSGAAQGVVDRHDVGWQRVARLSAALGVESALVNGAIKSLFRRARPVHEGKRPHALRMPATSSFPSGHASSAFMAARLLADGSRAKPLWYLAATIVATSRIHVRIHHASDVAGGAVLGIALGELAVRLAPLPRR